MTVSKIKKYGPNGHLGNMVTTVTSNLLIDINIKGFSGKIKKF